ncbi:MAG: MipA/OmpV family protein [Acidobacteria bacterium]|nr:MipA/OmpV family protein [Acidobacteriota bacterium]
MARLGFVTGRMGAALLACAPLAADEASPPRTGKDGSWNLEASLGVQVGTESSTSWMLPAPKSSPLVDLNFQHGRFFASGRRGVGWELVQDSRLTVAAGLGCVPGRREPEDDRLRGLGDVPASPALAATFDWHPLGDFLHAYLSLVKATRSGSGSPQTAGITLGFPVGGRVNGFLDLSQTWGDRNFVQRFFGVDSSQSASSRYPVFRPGAGRVNGAAVLGLATPVARKWSLVGTLGHTWLLGDCARSPIPARRHHATASLAVKFSIHP